MNRNSMKDLVAWKNSEDRKPLIIRGARQVGKTWIMKEFGKQYYKNFVYFNFDEEKAEEYHIVAAGSLLGTLLTQPKSYPVGMVNY